MARLVLNEGEVRRAAEKPAHDLVKQVIGETQRAAQVMIPKRSGRTARKFQSNVLTVSGRGVFGKLWNTSEVAWWLHEGTPIHPEPIRKPGPMTFFWEKVGHQVTFAHVLHPGIKPVRFLTDPLKVIGKRHGFRVETHTVGPS